MDIYEATQALLKEAAPIGVNVSAYVLTYDAILDKFDLPDFPAVTYNYALIDPIVDHTGECNLFRVNLDVEVWGDLKQIADNAKEVSEAINAQRIQVENVEFTLVCTEARDIAELGLDFKRRYMRFAGLVSVEEEAHEDSL